MVRFNRQDRIDEFRDLQVQRLNTAAVSRFQAQK